MCKCICSGSNEPNHLVTRHDPESSGFLLVNDMVCSYMVNKHLFVQTRCLMFTSQSWMCGHMLKFKLQTIKFGCCQLKSEMTHRRKKHTISDVSTLVRTWNLFNSNTAFDSSSLLVRVRCSFECESFGRPVPRQFDGKKA